MTRFAIAQRIALIVGAASLVQGCASTKQQTFSSPEAATDAFVSALSPKNDESLEQILGPGSEDLVSSGDPVADANNVSRFLDMYSRGHVLAPDGPEARTLLVGEDQWPFPIPIVARSGEWKFDTPAGRQEILDRRIGLNEIAAIESCLAYVDAQLEYAMLDPDADGVREYARQFLSDAGTKNGLYWAVGEYEQPSPLGVLVAQASDEGYSVDRSAGPRPYHGYLYTILLAQGPNAPDGARQYIINAHMIGGFALVARPAIYGSSGIMTFMVNQDGIVYQRDLGPKTESVAGRMSAFDPDSSWTVVNPQPYVGLED